MSRGPGRQPCDLIALTNQCRQQLDARLAAPQSPQWNLSLKDFSTAIKDFSDDHAEHLLTIPMIGEFRDSIARFVDHAKDDSEPRGKLLQTSKQVHCVYALKTLNEMTQAAQASLVSHCFTAAEALSRIIFEQAVNFIYILNDDGVNRLRALLKHYVEDSRRRAINWAKSSSQLLDQRGENRAMEKLKYLDSIRRGNDSWYTKTPGWPDARRRFVETGCEHQYHLLFASASDSVHSLAEDIFNLILWDGYPTEIKPAALEAIKIEKASFAVYMVTNAFAFYGNAALNFARELGNSYAIDGISEAMEKLASIVNSHDDLTAETLQRLEDGPAGLS